MAETDDLPTPPLPDAMARTLVVAGTALAGASRRTFQRALAMAADFCSAVISPQSILTDVTPGMSLIRPLISVWSWARNGQPDVVRTICTTTLSVGFDVGTVGHAEFDDVGAELRVDHPPEGGEDVVGAGERGPRGDSNGLNRVNSPA